MKGAVIMLDVSPVLTYKEIIIRIVCSLIVGIIIGVERENKHHAAGTRTHMLVSMGSCIAMLTNIVLINTYSSAVDPGRFGAAVISGIGFIGAGTIVHDKFSAKGLTTAAGVWAAACLGIASGAGFWQIAIAGAVVVFIILSVIYSIQKKVFGMRSSQVTLYLKCGNAVEAMSFLNDVFAKNKINISNIKVSDDGESKSMEIDFKFGGVHQKESMSDILVSLSENDNIKEVYVNYGDEI